MRILVAGATGKTGRRVVRALQDRNHTPIALVREGSDTSHLPSNIELRHGDLTDLPQDVAEGTDAVIFAAGSGSSTGPEMTDKVDLHGARALVDLSKKSGVSRFVMLSSVGAGSPEGTGDMEHYLKAKHDADEHLKASGLDYAILRPVALTDDDGRRHIRFGDDVDTGGEAARGDVAYLLADAVTNPEWSGQTQLMQSL
ncbi:SDR family oxidoreductase [Primorskyibacter sp. 2E107]|uniref:SDR family oxidoreductase n=1 Tax=Primorskyibacter sp. 2E107 TaxID=3403458 RepID=UPI003AF421EF